jgi:AcrR family transcriptional regulator
MAVAERVDVRRNRARLLDVTRQLFAERGVDVSVREVAGEAGIGIATLYRHFPTREELLDAVLEDAFEELVAAGERALATEDAWDAFSGLVEEALALCAHNRGLQDALETQRGRRRAASMRRRIRPVFAELVARAQEQGSLRGDFCSRDVQMLFWSISGVNALAADVAPELWRRQLGFVLDGLRAPAASPLRHPPVSDAQLRRIEFSGPPKPQRGVKTTGGRASTRRETDV